MTALEPTPTPPPAPSPTHPVLDPVEARVLATLMEKARTVPDSYPLTLNSLMLGCNQKTSREPIMNLDEGQIAAALDNLASLGLVQQNSSGRAAKYSHNFQRGIGVYEQAAVLLGMLMLRGPQTAGELRLNTDRWYGFADISSVEGFLEELLEWPAEKGGPLVVKLPKAPGTREQRWTHLLCGPVEASAFDAVTRSDGTVQSLGSTPGAALERIAQLETEVAALKRTVERLCTELGVTPEA